VSIAARRDYAEAAAIALVAQGHEGRVYELGGEQAYSLAEIAAEIARASGIRVVYQDLPELEYAAALQRMGVPEGYAKLLADADAGIRRGELVVESGDLRRLLGRPATPLSAVIEKALVSSARRE
jgi:NAD(P)H dehydrogenase (quinone)